MALDFFQTSLLAPDFLGMPNLRIRNFVQSKIQELRTWNYVQLDFGIMYRELCMKFYTLLVYMELLTLKNIKL